jgi:hypothetical protein
MPLHSSLTPLLHLSRPSPLPSAVIDWNTSKFAAAGQQPCMIYAAQFSKEGGGRYIVAGGSGANEAKVFDHRNGNAVVGTCVCIGVGTGRRRILKTALRCVLCYFPYFSSSSSPPVIVKKHPLPSHSLTPPPSAHTPYRHCHWSVPRSVRSGLLFR